MIKTVQTTIPRRRFLISAPVLVSGSLLTGFVRAQETTPQTAPSLPEKLSSAELVAVETSSLARDLKKYFGEGYSCAESMLMVGLHYLKKPEELVWVAGGFGGGMYHRDVCGIITGGTMVMGLAAGQLKKERAETKEWNKQKVLAYWAWWTSQAPLRCAEIRKEGTSFNVCRRLGLLAAAEIEKLIS
jgi:hypothetical protein